MTIAVELIVVLGCTQLRRKCSLSEMLDNGSAGDPRHGPEGGARRGLADGFRRGSADRSRPGPKGCSKRGFAGGAKRAWNVGFLPALQGRNGVLLVILVNVLTNPAAVLLCWLSRIYLPQVPQMPVQLAVETVVVSVEAWIYCSFAKEEGWKIEHPVFLSAAANLCSWLTGVLVQAVRR